MKKFIGVSLIIFLSVFSFAQEINQKNVPAVVLNAFQVKFATAYDIEWRLEKGSYKVEFEINNKDHWVILSDKGAILKHRQDLYVSEIPDAVLATMNSKVDYFDIYDADRMEENGNTIYYIDFKFKGKEYYFDINENGQLIKFQKDLRDNEIPTAIINTINSKYGDLDIDLSRFTEENGTVVYYIRGEINDKDHSFSFDHNATLTKRRQDLRNEEIPAAITKTLESKYKDFEIRDADLIEEGGKTIYDLELRKSKKKVQLIVNPKGKILEIK